MNILAQEERIWPSFAFMFYLSRWYCWGWISSLSLLNQMLTSSRNLLTETPRNNDLSVIRASLRPVRLTQNQSLHLLNKLSMPKLLSQHLLLGDPKESSSLKPKINDFLPAPAITVSCISTELLTQHYGMSYWWSITDCTSIWTSGLSAFRQRWNHMVHMAVKSCFLSRRPWGGPLSVEEIWTGQALWTTDLVQNLNICVYILTHPNSTYDISPSYPYLDIDIIPDTHIYL